MNEEVVLKFSKAEAIVLFEFTSRFTNTKELKIIDPSEQRVLWNICAMLEGVLVEPLKENYLDILNGARRKVNNQ